MKCQHVSPTLLVIIIINTHHTIENNTSSFHLNRTTVNYPPPSGSVPKVSAAYRQEEPRIKPPPVTGLKWPTRLLRMRDCCKVNTEVFGNSP